MKIDTSTIEGFAEMSADDKVTALLGVDLPEPVDLTGYVSKADHDTEVSGYLAALRKHMPEAEYAKQYGAAAESEIERKYNELLKKQQIADFTTRYTALGMSVEDAKKASEAQYFGDNDKLFRLLTKAQEDSKKAALAEAYRSTPKPEGAGKRTMKDSEEESLAKRIGKRNADAAKRAAEVLKNYL